MDLTNNKIYRYLRNVTEFTSVQTDDGVAILTKQFDKLQNLNEDSAANLFLNPHLLIQEKSADEYKYIFPFGCNKSQFIAVNRALNNRISIIEGPPGTGKTQTILNIIANLVVEGKSVLVVSNNNSAIENIVEKLASDKYKMDFFVALLGRNAQKEKFVAEQTGKYPDLSSWENRETETKEFTEALKEKSKKLQKVYDSQIESAKLKQELYDVELEEKHFSFINKNTVDYFFNRDVASRKILTLLHEYQDIKEGRKKAGLWYKLMCYFRYNVNMWKLLQEDTAKVKASLQSTYYTAKTREINKRLDELAKASENIHADELLDEFTDMSLSCFRSNLASKYKHNEQRKVFTNNSLWRNYQDFLKEYPVVLSTTYTARSSLGKYAFFDYIIMDEASQVDIPTGLLALSAAKNAIIVGDTLQLPNIVSSQKKLTLQTLFEEAKISNAYNCAEYSFMSSLYKVMGERVSKTILREHYRCHPQIIGFCNQKFYKNDLIIINQGDNTTALQLNTTVPGSHARDRMNQRQIDVIKREVLPNLKNNRKEIGIIAPYRRQVECLKREICDKDIEISTVHKFQGREKEVIILSLVDDVVTSFSDDPNLLNVAISRAKKKLIVVTSADEQPTGSIVSDLIGYIKYNNCDVAHSEISSVFDYLYKEYEVNRLEYLRKNKRISEFDSENLMYALIKEEIGKRNDIELDVVCHQPLQLLLKDISKLNVEETRFVNTGLSHIDFLIYNHISKEPILAIEVDGYNYHKEGTKQAERDKIKNHILEVYNLPLLRFKTNGSEEGKILSAKLDELLTHYSNFH